MPFKTSQISKQALGIDYTGSWTGLSVGTEVQIEDASNISFGAGTFGYDPNSVTDGLQFADGTGSSAAHLVEGTDYNYDEYLDNTTGGVDIYDDNASGAFDSGKYFRIVENGKNIIDGTGLNLRVVAKNLSSNITPPDTECWVDPKIGKFILPGPVFASNCESLSNILTPNRNISGNIPSIIYTLGGTYTEGTGKFGNCVGIGNPVAGISSQTEIILIPEPSFTTCAISLWIKSDTSWTWPKFYIGDKYIEFVTPGSDTYIRRTSDTGIVATVLNTLGLSPETWYHIYIIMDEAKGISGGKSISVLKDNVELISYAGDIDISGGKISIVNSTYSGSYSSLLSLDNIKIWNDVLDEDAAWLYNSGTGREQALHKTLYASGNNYAPLLDDSSTPDSGVGYYYIPTANTPASLTEASYSGASVKWTK